MEMWRGETELPSPLTHLKVIIYTFIAYQKERSPSVVFQQPKFQLCWQCVMPLLSWSPLCCHGRFVSVAMKDVLQVLGTHSSKAVT